MRLCTYHPPDYDIRVPCDLSKSFYYEQDFLGTAYDWLFKEIGTRSVVWCYPYDFWPKWEHSIETVQWTLEVPDEEIVSILDGDVWNDIIMNTYHYRDKTYNWWYWDFKCQSKFTDHDEFIEFAEKRWQDKHGPKEEFWKRCLFKERVFKHRYPQILIPSPVKDEWILDKCHFSFYDLEAYTKYGCTRWCDTQDEVDQILAKVKPFLDSRNIKYSVDCEQKNGKILVDVDIIDQEDE